MPSDDRMEGLVDVPRLAAWLDGHVSGPTAPLEVTRITAGASSELFELRRGDWIAILRRPAQNLHDPEAFNRIMLREHRVLTALEQTRVPHPKPLAVCEDTGVIGAAFYVMERIDGFAPRDPLPPPFDRDPAARRGLGLELIDTLAELANVDWRAVGLEGFGKPDQFLERQVGRWLGQLNTYKTRELPGLEVTARWLEEHRPAMSAPAIMHGDYQFINVMFHHGAPARLAAVVDWEQATIGDPLLDLGWVLAGWTDPGEDRLRFGSSYFGQRDGLPTRAELTARYAERTGRALDALDYYVVLAWFKLACVLEGAYTRWVKGMSKSDVHRMMGDMVLALLQAAEERVSRARG
jgi:aminoglycoside phosphotransferase (APT) family kinase protein